MQHQLMQMQQQQQQQPMVMTTDHIQQYLDENKWLILKILENQNSGKLSENAENQARLQQNLMYLAAIADCQPQMSFVFDQSWDLEKSVSRIPRKVSSGASKLLLCLTLTHIKLVDLVVQK
ncbi:hypothetical protein CsSME_00046970 [Camellia sinensis var. sinensis]